MFSGIYKILYYLLNFDCNCDKTSIYIYFFNRFLIATKINYKPVYHFVRGKQRKLNISPLFLFGI